ncbi:uncharacterized protein N7482_006729 [Penicillium canariense]|uniref:Uncharacterized protein n=1 Tax=Penicillium canariense TaxID=189055 RepID=A0A9W9LJ82_9EURO|nr:uncharacterized protein N7482_006729 [Penicillium canariense]KAJ5159725.1 hypothetical protein N7482_006729 [Penicillium canariense]
MAVVVDPRKKRIVLREILETEPIENTSQEMLFFLWACARFQTCDGKPDEPAVSEVTKLSQSVVSERWRDLNDHFGDMMQQIDAILFKRETEKRKTKKQKTERDDDFWM